MSDRTAIVADMNRIFAPEIRGKCMGCGREDIRTNCCVMCRRARRQRGEGARPRDDRAASIVLAGVNHRDDGRIPSFDDFEAFEELRGKR